MNSLSWLLYLADAANSVSSLFSFLGAVFTVLGVLSLAFATVAAGMRADALGKLYLEEAQRAALVCSWEAWISLWKGPRKFLWWGVILLLVACILPSKQTIYAIAASQVGEKILKSDTVQGVSNEAVKALQIWIKKQIEPQDLPKKKSASE